MNVPDWLKWITFGRVAFAFAFLAFWFTSWYITVALIGLALIIDRLEQIVAELKKHRALSQAIFAPQIAAAKLKAEAAEATRAETRSNGNVRG